MFFLLQPQEAVAAAFMGKAGYVFLYARILAVESAAAGKVQAKMERHFGAPYGRSFS